MKRIVLLVVVVALLPACNKKKEWTKVSLSGAERVPTIAVDPKAPKTVFVGIGAASTQRGFFRTKDGGNSWTKLGGGLPNDNAGMVLVSPHDGSVLVNPGVEGMWRSTDGGETFAHASPQPGSPSWISYHPLTSTVYAVTSQQGCYRSTDNGKTWAHMGNAGVPLNRFPLGPIVSDGAKTYMGTGGQGIYVSTDDGNNWVKAAGAGLPDSGAGGDAVAMLAPTPGVVYLQTAGAGLFRSNDGGASFTKLPIAHTRHAALRLDPSNPQRIVVSGDDRADVGGIFESKDGGKSFAPIGPKGIAVADVAVASDGTLYIGTVGDGVYRF
jgi:photosystem II stability/assembly factor-like uncharacterized protein